MVHQKEEKILHIPAFERPIICEFRRLHGGEQWKFSHQKKESCHNFFPSTTPAKIDPGFSFLWIEQFGAGSKHIGKLVLRRLWATLVDLATADRHLRCHFTHKIVRIGFDTFLDLFDVDVSCSSHRTLCGVYLHGLTVFESFDGPVRSELHRF